ncbi:hypothetical protein RB5554 [Rhodopirellula baltica SH 1]|uniref:Uncharacterized protein n=1 Tax=Rhodopirellula baltica (strain DSM 10527 / NCIMB 13988 / SH1) TaxID=243090 RepID=Q7URN4_RHOBA|nr:hypothetical protein RB5554 [Rhodopirellula baltica SH 1]
MLINLVSLWGRPLIDRQRCLPIMRSLLSVTRKALRTETTTSSMSDDIHIGSAQS